MKYLNEPVKKTIVNNLIFKLHKIIGWEMGEGPPPGSYIYISEHTSNWDFIHGIFYYKILNLNGYFAIAEEKTKYIPFNICKFFRILPIPRTSSGLKILIDELKKNNASIYIAPEGTRNLTDGWKPGFHVLAKKFKMPIVIVGVGYNIKKHLTLGIVDAGKDVEETIERCKAVLDANSNIAPLHPKKLSPRCLAEKYRKNY